MKTQPRRARVAGIARKDTARRSRLLPQDGITRRLAVVTLVNTFGNGLFFTVSALFFTRIVGLSALQVGTGLTIAGACGVLAGVPLGRLADRHGARRVLLVLCVGEALAMLAYLEVGGFASFLAVVCVVTLLDRGASAVRNGLLAVVLPAEGRVAARAYLRAVTNVGIGLGLAAAAVALHADTRAAYLTLIVLDAVTFLISAALLAGLPATPPVGPRRAQPAAPLADRPYLAITALNGVLSLQFALLEVGVPLWVSEHTRAPRLVVSATLVLNTLLVVLLQVRAGRSATTLAAAGRACRRGALLLAAACLVYAAAAGESRTIATAVLIAAAAVQTFGEVLTAAGGWALSYELADPAAPSAYQGVFNSGFAAAIMLGPVVVTSSAIAHGGPGWVALAALFAVAGLAVPGAGRWAQRHRPFAG